MRAIIAGLMLICVMLQSQVFAAQPKSAAVIVYPQSALAKQYARIAQARIEQILTDNGVTVLDQQQAERLKKNWKKLADPGALITAEEFVSNAGKYDIDGVYRIYLDAGLTRGLADIYTATALSDIRFLGEDAQVSAAASPPMGAKGMPPSDGLTDSAALSNAIQRSIDMSAQTLGLKILDFANPRLFNVKLQAMSPAVSYTAESVPDKQISDKEVAPLVALKVSDNWNEKINFIRRSSDERMAAVVTSMLHQSYFDNRVQIAPVIHVIDLNAKKEAIVFKTGGGTQADKGRGDKILDCLFVSNWRFLAAVTGSRLYLWDTERGLELSWVYLDEGIGEAVLEFGRSADKKDYLAVTSGSRKMVYQIVRDMQ